MSSYITVSDFKAIVKFLQQDLAILFLDIDLTLLSFKHKLVSELTYNFLYVENEKVGAKGYEHYHLMTALRMKLTEAVLMSDDIFPVLEELSSNPNIVIVAVTARGAEQRQMTLDQLESLDILKFFSKDKFGEPEIIFQGMDKKSKAISKLLEKYHCESAVFVDDKEKYLDEVRESLGDAVECILFKPINPPPGVESTRKFVELLRKHVPDVPFVDEFLLEHEEREPTHEDLVNGLFVPFRDYMEKKK